MNIALRIPSADIPNRTADSPQVVAARQMRQQTTETIRKSLTDAVLPSGALSASVLQAAWFPAIEATVFISHSSRETDKANLLAEHLADCGVTAFVDSQVWSHMDGIQKSIDDQYCKNEGGSTYSYDKRNATTTHVRMILASALTTMIERCDVLVFLESPQSIAANQLAEVPENTTFSPWIFHELFMAATISRVKESEKLEKVADSRMDSFGVEYPVELDRLRDVAFRDLMAAASRAGSTGSLSAALRSNRLVG